MWFHRTILFSFKITLMKFVYQPYKTLLCPIRNNIIYSMTNRSFVPAKTIHNNVNKLKLTSSNSINLKINILTLKTLFKLEKQTYS